MSQRRIAGKGGAIANAPSRILIPPPEIIKFFALTRKSVHVRARVGTAIQDLDPQDTGRGLAFAGSHGGGVSGLRDRNDEPLYTAEIRSKVTGARLTPFILTPDTPGTSRSRCRIATAYVTDRMGQAWQAFWNAS